MERRLLWTLPASAALLGFAVPTAASARAPDSVPVLDQILKRGVIRITAEVTSPPFGFMNKSNEPDGLEISAARQMAKDLGVKIDLVQVTGPDRIPALLSGRADVAISSLSITLARAKTIAFANPHGALRIVIAAPASTKITGPADLAGKRIGLTRATLEEATVPKEAPKGTRLVYFDDMAATMQALISGQIDAAGMSGFAAKSVSDRDPAKHIVPHFTVTTAYYAAAVRPGDWDLLHWINAWVFIKKQDGFLADIYKQYTGLTLPELPVVG